METTQIPQIHHFVPLVEPFCFCNHFFFILYRLRGQERLSFEILRSPPVVGDHPFQTVALSLDQHRGTLEKGQNQTGQQWRRKRIRAVKRISLRIPRFQNPFGRREVIRTFLPKLS